MFYAVSRIAPVAALVLLACAASLLTAPTAHAASYTDLRIVSGLTGNNHYAEPHADPCGTDYWHCDETGWPSQAALDIHPAGNDFTGTHGWFESVTLSPYGYAYATVTVVPPGSCPGVQIHLWIPRPDSATGTWVGWVHYLQISPTITNGSYFYTSTSPGSWTVVDLGPVAITRPCSAWTGPHLHQSGGTGPNIYNNWSLNDDNGATYGVRIYPASDYSSNWLQDVLY